LQRFCEASLITMSTAEPTRKFARLRQRKPADSWSRRLREAREWLAFFVLGTAAISSILITAAIVLVLVFESWSFFRAPQADHQIDIVQFFTGTEWAPLFNPPKYGILPLVSATIMTTLIALSVALPLGTVIALYLREFAPFVLRESIKPSLELLSAVPTVVYGYFALMFVSPILQAMISDLPGQHADARHCHGDHDHPIHQLAQRGRHAGRANAAREGSYARGDKSSPPGRVVVPSALSGIGSVYPRHLASDWRDDDRRRRRRHASRGFTFNPTEQAQTIPRSIVATSQGRNAGGLDRLPVDFRRRLVLFAMTLIFNVLGYGSPAGITRRTSQQSYSSKLQVSRWWQYLGPLAEQET
jgi:phosphate transport system permease protein